MASEQSPANDQQARRQFEINAGIVALARQDLAAVWPQIDWAHPDAAGAVKQLYGAVIQRYGQSAASVASLMYDEIRDSANLARSYTSVVADPVDQAHIDAVVDSAFLGNAGPVGKPAEPSNPAETAPPANPSGPRLTDAEQADENTTTSDLPLEQRVPARLENTATRLVQQPGRDTIVENVGRDPIKPRWIRVPTSAHPCAFCVMMASREIYYTSSKAAGVDGTSIFNTYHDHCMCVAVPVFTEQEASDFSPNFADYQDMYYKSAANAGTRSDPKKILAAMRQIYGVK